MKKLFTLVACMVSLYASAQNYYYLTFDGADTLHSHLITVDTTNYHHNKWQVGAPHKTNFTSALSTPNVIITDTLNPYSANDTSVFILKMPKRIPAWPGSTFYGPLDLIQFEYQLETDPSTVARVEISEDSGMHWFNVNDSLVAPYYWQISPDTIVQTTGAWKHFSIARYYSPLTDDSTLFRFTLIAGSTTTGHDGWMIDNMFIHYYFEGAVGQIQNDNLISLYPNPSKGKIYIHSNQPISTSAAVFVYDINGRQVYKQAVTSTNSYLDLSLSPGTYTLRFQNGDQYCTQKLLITN